MAYSVKNKKHGKTYYLHSRKQTLKGGHIQTPHFQIGRKGPLRHRRDVLADPAFFLGETATVNNVAAGRARAGDHADF